MAAGEERQTGQPFELPKSSTLPLAQQQMECIALLWRVRCVFHIEF